MKKWKTAIALAMLVFAFQGYAKDKEKPVKGNPQQKAGEGSGVGNGGPDKTGADLDRLRKEVGHLNLKNLDGSKENEGSENNGDETPENEKGKGQGKNKNPKNAGGKKGGAADGSSDNSTDTAEDSAGDRLLPQYRRLQPPSRSSLDQVLGWCSRVTVMLERELKRAKVQLQYQRFALVRQILNNALQVASESLEVDPTFGGPMTKVLVDRALILNKALDVSLPEADRLTETTKTNFSMKFVQEILDLEKSLDRPWYVPYRYRYGQCYPDDCPNQFRYPDFEKLYVEYARDQLRFIVDEFTMVVPGGRGKSKVIPIGSAQAFLIMSELMSGFIAEDLASNLYAYANACAVRDLMGLSADLNAYNHFNDRTIFPNEPFAVSAVRETLDEVIGNIISGDCSGPYYPYPYPPQY